MSTEPQQLEAAMVALEAQRTVLGDFAVDTMLAGLRAKLSALSAQAPPPAPAQALKQVSILFLDVVGSTTLAQRLDPEAVSAVMDDALARGTAIVQAHRGRALQYAGDNILAAFGADEAREDDAERAVRCGLALLELGRELAGEVLRSHQHSGFDVRVGLHTGGVLLGGGVDADGSIRGIAVNIAARMEQTAPAGALRISHDTYAQVRGMFEVEVQAPLAVKGVDEPVQSYLVIRAKPRTFRIGSRGIEGVATRMIGRDAELEQLQDAFKRLYEHRTLAAVTVVADAGIGKSRLLYEFEAWSEARPEAFFIFRGRATPQTQGQPFGLLRDILAWRLQIADDDTLDVARAKIEQGIMPLFEHDDGADLSEGHAHLLGHLIGIEWRDSRHVKGILDDPRQIRNRAFHAAAQTLRRVSASDGSPIVLQLEDLHWADNESLDFLAYLSEVNRDVPMLVLASSRPALFERRAAWCADALHIRLDLAPLDKRASRDLANELLKKLPEVPAALRELVIGGSEGNPFYMEELVKMLIDQGAIETGEAWKVNAERLLLTRVPSALTGVLQARLDGLPAAEKLTLQRASVIGPVFWDRALIALDEQAATTLPRLVQRELALPRPNAHSDELREYAFKHAILHQVTYATVLKRTRQALHGKVAQWLAAQTGLRANDFLAAAAEHFEQAGDDAIAAEFHARAAEQAETRMAHEAVLSHVQRALALIDKREADPSTDTRPLRWRLLVTREATLYIQGDRAGQRADIAAMDILADKLDDNGHRAHAAWRRTVLALLLGDWPAMEAAARRAVEWAQAPGSAAGDELRLLAQRLLALALYCQGAATSARSLALEALAEARALGLSRVESVCLSTLALVSAGQGDDVAALMLHRESLAALLAAGDRRSEAVERCSVGGCWLLLGEFAAAASELDESLRLSRANGDRGAHSSALCSLSMLARWQGDDARALALARAALEEEVSVQRPVTEIGMLWMLGEAELALGRYAAAGQALAQAHARAVHTGIAFQHDASAALARVALAQGDVAAALQALGPLLALDAQAGAGGVTLEGTDLPRLIELTCHQVLAKAGDARAAGWLRRAHDAMQATADRITDPRLRAGFLQNIPHHREILAAWTRSLADTQQ